MVQVHDVGPGTGEHSGDGGDGGAETAVLTHRDAAALQRPRPSSQRLTFADVAHELGALTARLDPVKLVERRGPQDAVGCQSDVLLEVRERQ